MAVSWVERNTSAFFLLIEDLFMGRQVVPIIIRARRRRHSRTVVAVMALLAGRYDNLVGCWVMGGKHAVVDRIVALLVVWYDILVVIVEFGKIKRYVVLD